MGLEPVHAIEDDRAQAGRLRLPGGGYQLNPSG